MQRTVAQPSGSEPGKQERSGHGVLEQVPPATLGSSSGPGGQGQERGLHSEAEGELREVSEEGVTCWRFTART